TFGKTPLDLGGQSLLTVTEDPSGKLLIGGMFSQVNGYSIGGIARLDANGNLDRTFNIGNGFGFPGGYPEVHKILIKNDPVKDADDYGILVGGLFKTFKGLKIDGNAKSGLVQLNLNGTFNRSFRVTDDCCSGGGVRDMVFDNTGNIVVGGEFGVAGGITTKRIARLNRNGGTPAKPPLFDVSFTPLTTKVPDNAINSVLVLPDGKILVGGKFNAFLDFGPGGGGKPVPEVGRYLARLNANGTLDIPSVADADVDFAPIDFAPPTTYSLFEPGIQAMKLDPMGRVLVGGRFSSPAGNFIRLESDSSALDVTFNINAGFDGPVLDFLIRDFVDSKGGVVVPGGRIVTVGDFTSFDRVDIQQNVLELADVSVLADFSIKLQAIKVSNSEVNLKWMGNNSILTYEIQRSINGSQFQTIGARSTTSSVTAFQYKDQALQGYPYLYYRVAAKGQSGEYYYSNVVKVAFSTSEASLLPLSASSVRLKYAGGILNGSKVVIQSITADGKLHLQKEVAIGSRSVETVVPLPVPLTEGFLLLRDEQGAVLYKTYYRTPGK
ncbi:MAG TPA: delta-60 repeat domain-containing protein, partial [Flavisolibacter sp.]|nr:delta-60 repeat domain-containing protein [Flavisolibacter sp.]